MNEQLCMIVHKRVLGKLIEFVSPKKSWWKEQLSFRLNMYEEQECEGGGKRNLASPPPKKRLFRPKDISYINSKI
jgi:hypothetical protein